LTRLSHSSRPLELSKKDLGKRQKKPQALEYEWSLALSCGPFMLKGRETSLHLRASTKLVETNQVEENGK